MTVENREIEDRVVRYWTVRSHDFGTIRKNELGNAMGRRWLEELEAGLPQGRPLRILDVGTGTGFFAILMARLGHRVTGIDLTPAMLEEASATAAGLAGEYLRRSGQPEPDLDSAGAGEGLCPVVPGPEARRCAPEF